MSSIHDLWKETLVNPDFRSTKPRSNGCTMVLDKGLGLGTFHDLLQIAGEYIDFIKLGFGTAGITPQKLLQEKIALANQYQVGIYPGGTFLEIAYAKKMHHHYLETISSLGIKWLEISDGMIELSLSERSSLIRQAQEIGFDIITEIGKKSAGSALDIESFLRIYEHDRSHGATFIIVEGRESGKNIGIYDEKGHICIPRLKAIFHQTDPDAIIWEAPQTSQQIEFLKQIGPKVNLGNISPPEVLSLECLRRGLRADTFSLTSFTK
ncbi:phosphosulfolactate synthase [Thermoactinomyces mirandus]|uniref:Phosphosulfolactate synthase n=1 Tax=Thermoactinomyces mirandus TaxID=2756294 RepID=A0A7W1XPZ1_9BACL|nr:phosphosulfolactate synthase [Thermoactinomyces mirandus]MBA4600895.1 phosphosulfolactate synthase [Thermoactinomyces mirandus]